MAADPRRAQFLKAAGGTRRGRELVETSRRLNALLKEALPVSEIDPPEGIDTAKRKASGS